MNLDSPALLDALVAQKNINDTVRSHLQLLSDQYLRTSRWLQVISILCGLALGEGAYLLYNYAKLMRCMAGE